ncbi:MAG: metal ABC transporter permease [Nocardioidaceae bacterium]
MSVLTLDFVVRALVAALFTGLAAPVVGTYLVQRRLALLGDGIGHISVTGVALGLLTGTSPTFTAIVIAILGALTIELIRISGRASADVALALLFYGGIAGGVFLINLAGNGAFTLQQYLFGSITTISPSDMWVAVGLALAVIVLGVGLMPQLFALCLDEEYAKVSGIPVRFYSVLLAVLAAVSVSVAMRTVGLLLVSALMVVPVATSQQLSRGFRSTMLAAMGLGLVASIAGVVTSAFVDVPPGATIVLLSLAGFVAAYPFGMWVRRRQRLAVPFEEAPSDESAHLAVPEQHEHQHGEDCGHTAVRHGDHVDYVHEGHRHAEHGSHYDEH